MAAVPEEHSAAADADEERALYERHAARILAFCVRQLRSREDAEDAAQTTFVNALRAIRAGVEPRSEEAWLYSIARNVCLSHLRAAGRRRRVELPSDLEIVQETVPGRQPDADELLVLREALDWMPPTQRNALLMREWRGLSYEEIGSELGLSQPAVEALLFRARKTLARGLEEQWHAAKRAKRSTKLSLVAFLKSLLAGGGAKLAATATVVAMTAAAAATPAIRHDLVHAVAGPHRGPLRVVGAPAHTSPRAPAHLLARHAPVVATPARQRRTPAKPQPRAVLLSLPHVVRGSTSGPHRVAAGVEAPHPAPAPAPPPAEPAPQQSVVHEEAAPEKPEDHGRVEAPAARPETPAAAPDASADTPSAGAPGRRRHDRGRPSGRPGTPPAQPPIAPPVPVPPVPAPAVTPPDDLPAADPPSPPAAPELPPEAQAAVSAAQSAVSTVTSSLPTPPPLPPAVGGHHD